MTLQINTVTIRRLRDALIANGQLITCPEPDLEADERDPRQEASLKRVAPFAETMFLMMMADGTATQSEKDAIRGALAMLTHGCIQQTRLDELLGNFKAMLARQGVKYRLQTLGSRISADRQDRETAFTLAAAVALADEEIATGEFDLILDIADWYGISERRAKEIVEQVGRSN